MMWVLTHNNYASYTVSVFVCTGFFSLASFTAVVTNNQLATC